MEILRVSTKSDTKGLAGSIEWAVRKEECAEIQAIEAGAVNQAIKSIAIARSYLSLSGVEFMCFPAFLSVTIEEKAYTAIKFIVVLTSLNEIKPVAKSNPLEPWKNVKPFPIAA